MPRNCAQKRSPSIPPQTAQVLARRGGELFDGVDAGTAQTLQHRRADTAQILQFQPVQRLRQIAQLDHGQAVDLLHVGGGLGQEGVRGDADRAADRRSEPAIDQGLLDPVGDRDRVVALAFAADQAASDFVDRQRFAVDRNAILDRRDQTVMQIDVARRARFDDGDIGAARHRFVHRRAGLDAMSLSLAAGGDAAGGGRQHRHHADRTAAQFLAVELLDRGEVGIEVDEQAAQGHGGGPAWGRYRAAQAAARDAPGGRCGRPADSGGRPSRLLRDVLNQWAYRTIGGSPPTMTMSAGRRANRPTLTTPGIWLIADSIATGSVIARPWISRMKLPLSVTTPAPLAS